MSRYDAISTSYVLNDYWRHSYQGIYAANQVIENTPKIDADEQTKQIIVGEAKFIRAFFYFYLLNDFGHIPLITKTPKSEKEFYTPQAEPEAVWAQIEQDLQDAKAVLPDQWPGEWLGRATKGAATAFLGKVYLFQKKWSLAEQEFRDVMNMGYGLVDDFESLFTGENEWSEESIFEINFTMDDQGGRNERNSLPVMLSYWKMDHPNQFLKNLYMQDTTTTGEYTQRVYGSIVFNDPKSYIWYFGSGTFADYYGADDPNAYWKKYCYYPGQDANNGYSVTHSGINFIVIRYADVLLMLAEALNELGNTSEAVELVNQVRARAGAVPIPATMSQDELREHIRHVERPLELAGECVRWFDLLRWYGDGDLQSILRQHGREGWENFQNGVDIYYPIPFDELSANPYIVQNPGY